MTIDPSNLVDLLCWWQQYQAKMLHREADLIRNDLLQDMFAIRRCLELSCQTQPNAKDFGCESRLAELKHISTLLENLSDRLEMPFLQDSLPLALQHAIQPRRQKIHLRAEFPPNWESEPVEQSRLLIMLADNLFQLLVTADPSPHHCDITLQHQVGIKEFTFQALYRESLAPSLTAEASKSLRPILETFQLFTQGEYTQDIQSRSLTWSLRWRTQHQT